MNSLKCMNIEDLSEEAELNFRKHLKENCYPGRGIVLGCDSGGNPVLIYWIMGRSVNSRNRIFTLTEEGVLRTEAADSSLLEDPSLIIYNAVLRFGQGYLVTNGDHTDRIAAIMKKGGSFHEALLEEKHEPDPPNFTPRIAGLISQDTSGIKMVLGLVCRSHFTSERSEVHVHHLPLMKPGFGFGITTYQHDGNPLPHFQGNPLILPIQGRNEEVTDRYWNALDSENRVSLAMLRAGSIPASPEWEIRNARNQPNEPG